MIKNIIYLTTILFLSSCSSTTDTNSKPQNKAVSLTKKAKTKCECKNINESIGKTSAASWFKEHDFKQTFEELSNRKEIEQKYYYDVRPLKLPIAIRALNSEPILELKERMAKYYNPHFKSEKGMKPYLIRGVFANFTGGLSMYKNKNIITVSSFSLGEVNGYLFTPLIVNLPKKPSKLILSVGSAM